MPKNDLVFLVDVDNTLIDNDAVREDFRRRLLDFLGRRRHRTTVTDESVEQGTGAYKRAACLGQAQQPGASPPPPAPR